MDLFPPRRSVVFAYFSRLPSPPQRWPTFLPYKGCSRQSGCEVYQARFVTGDGYTSWLLLSQWCSWPFHDTHTSWQVMGRSLYFVPIIHIWLAYPRWVDWPLLRHAAGVFVAGPQTPTAGVWFLQSTQVGSIIAPLRGMVWLSFGWLLMTEWMRSERSYGFCYRHALLM